MEATTHFTTLNTSTNNTLTKIQFITSVKLLHVSALGRHPQGVLERRSESPTLQSQYFTAHAGKFTVLKF